MIKCDGCGARIYSLEDNAEHGGAATCLRRQLEKKDQHNATLTAELEQARAYIEAAERGDLSENAQFQTIRKGWTGPHLSKQISEELDQARNDIVRCVNAHDELVTALENILGLVSSPHIEARLNERIADNAKKALAKARAVV